MEQLDQRGTVTWCEIHRVDEYPYMGMHRNVYLFEIALRYTDEHGIQTPLNMAPWIDAPALNLLPGDEILLEWLLGSDDDPAILRGITNLSTGERFPGVQKSGGCMTTAFKPIAGLFLLSMLSPLVLRVLNA